MCVNEDCVIEEMEQTLCNARKVYVYSKDIAEHLYNAGYRKQVEAKWIVCGAFGDFLKCSACGYDRPWQTAIEHKFCPNCGAKMKGANNEQREAD